MPLRVVAGLLYDAAGGLAFSAPLLLVAVALVMSHESVAGTNHELVGGVSRTATEHNHLCRGSADTMLPSASCVWPANRSG